ncbi:MAG: TIGR02466 family protein [Pseudomonadota bacterium]
MSTRLLFPTRLYEAGIGDTSLIADLEDAIWMLEDGDEAGRAWCEREGYDGYTSYASLDDLPDRATAFASLKNVLDQQAIAFSKDIGWDLSGRRLNLDSLWVNVLGEGGTHSGHIHPNSVISGTAYISTPDGAGALKLEDPRLPMMQAAPPLKSDPSEDQKRFIYVPPSPGLVLMWESWLRHEVMPNRSEDPRLSVSFNYALESG